MSRYKTHQEFLALLPEDEQRAIKAEFARLLAEYEAMQAMRKARRFSQKAVASKLKVGQAEVSKLERRTDMYISSLRKYIEALGGELQITVKFADHPPVVLTQFCPKKET